MNSLKDILKVEGIMSRGYGVMPKLVLQDVRLTRDAKAIYAYMCSFAGAGTTAFPGTDKICTDLGFKKIETMVKHRKQLEKYGYIKVEQERNAQGKFARNIYTIMQFPEEISEVAEEGEEVLTERDRSNPPYPEKRDSVKTAVPRSNRTPKKASPLKGDSNNNRSFKINRSIKNNNRQQQELDIRDLDQVEQEQKIKPNVVVSEKQSDRINLLLDEFWKIADKRNSDYVFIEKLLLTYSDQDILNEIKKISKTYNDKSLIRNPKALLTVALRTKFDEPENQGGSVSIDVTRLRKALKEISSKRFGLSFEAKLKVLEETGSRFSSEAIEIIRNEEQILKDKYKDVYMN